MKTPEVIAKAVDEMVRAGECEVVFDDDNNVKKITITNIGHNKGKSASIADINQAISDGLILGREKRRYRHRDQLPNPDEPANSESNRDRVRITLRLTEREVRLLDEWRGATDRTTWIRQQLFGVGDPEP